MVRREYRAEKKKRVKEMKTKWNGGVTMCGSKKL